MTALAQPLSWRTILHRYLANRQRMAMFTQQYGLGHGPLAVDGERVYQARQEGVSGPTTLIDDQFLDTDGVIIPNHIIAPTNVPGAVWVAYEAAGTSMSILSNRANAVYQSVRSYAVNSGVYDATISANILCNTSGVASSGLIVRQTDINNKFAILFFGSLFVIYQVIGGSYIARASIGGVVHNTEYLTTVVLSGNLITATAGALSPISYSSSANATAIIHGLRCAVSSPGISVYVDNFKVTVP